ncbi:MAG: YdiU family protein [Pseudomonadota bacterium]
MSTSKSAFVFDNTFARSLEGFYIPVDGHQVPNPRMLHINEALATELGLSTDFLCSENSVEILAGKVKPEDTVTLAQAYAGHQFGAFSPSLGDGRAMLLGEIIDINGNRRDLQLKGSGPTPFSRNGDGKAALGPVLREYLISEAMHAFGVPTTRSLAAVTTGENVFRETALTGAVLTRVASSHLRVGTFQFFAARGQGEQVQKLADYAIERHFPKLIDQPDRYLRFLQSVIAKQIDLIASWMSIGFVHGVMNTDNMTISGETIDYGPCAFMDTYRSDAVFSSIDEMGRYAYNMQPLILPWNLARLAECLLPLLNPNDKDAAIEVATTEINAIPQAYEKVWLEKFAAKLGIFHVTEEDKELIQELLEIMEAEKADFTASFRKLSGVLLGDENNFLAQFNTLSSAHEWLETWKARLKTENKAIDDHIKRMDTTNPIYIPRNDLVEEALTAAEVASDLNPFRKLLAVVSKPFDRQSGAERYEVGASADARPYVTYCGT